MTDDEKTRFELLKLRMSYSPGQARELAEKDYEWIKNAGSAAATEPSGNHLELSDVKRARAVVEALTPPHWEKES